ncbi:TrkA, K+ transport system, NAD-binding component [Halapricum desulfuricans]|uniref:TrkA, K+ transport system, NAD-binding component n=2 Tax=Halapricum desulfuricans TaxID=2841257 RepID=A0A897N1P2_9EURY|nr:TrkA, K+ transport system, NAD-binding component [Halapricum desulfuricans]
MHVIVAGADTDEIAAAIESQGHEVTVLDIANQSALEDAGIETAGALVLTEVAQATAIPVAKELNPDLRTLVYASESLPEFVRGQVDLAIDPELLDADTVAEELDA